MFMPARFPLILLLLLSVALLGGCGSRPKMGRYEYRVSMSESLRDSGTGMMPSVEVDFVGVSEHDLARWERLRIDDYFEPNNPQRVDTSRYTIHFSNEDSGTQRLTADDPMWAKWKGAVHMLIIASVPLTTDNVAVDPRRLMLPLDRSRWRRGEPIDIRITPHGIVVATPLIPLRD